MTKKKEVEEPLYLKGKYTEYELIDEAYHVAVVYQDAFKSLESRKEGIQSMLSRVAAQAANLLELVALEEQLTWGDIREDLGLDKNTPYRYIGGVIHKMEPEEVKEVLNDKR
jgi:chaperonin cofactor prefoldin